MPSPADLITLYPAFASVPLATAQAWIDDAVRVVPVEWVEHDAAVLALAAHRLAELGLGDSVAPGVTSVRSGSFSMTLKDGGGAGLGSTAYGRAYLAIRGRYITAGPRVY